MDLYHIREDYTQKCYRLPIAGTTWIELDFGKAAVACTIVCNINLNRVIGIRYDFPLRDIPLKIEVEISGELFKRCAIAVVMLIDV